MLFPNVATVYLLHKYTSATNTCLKKPRLTTIYTYWKCLVSEERRPKHLKIFLDLYRALFKLSIIQNYSFIEWVRIGYYLD